MKVLVNIVITLIVLTALLSTIWIGVETGRYWALVYISCILALYFFITWPFQQATLMYAIQYSVTHTLINLAIMGLGFFAVWLGISEFSAPIDSSRTLLDLIFNLIRNTVGSIGVSLLMWWFGGKLILIAISYFRTHKLAIPNQSIKRDA